MAVVLSCQSCDSIVAVAVAQRSYHDESYVDQSGLGFERFVLFHCCCCCCVQFGAVAVGPLRWTVGVVCFWG